MIRVRFALAPSGHLLAGQARVALANALFALNRKGQAILRLDDLDDSRCKPGFAEAMIQDLQWFGIAWDETIRQSDRRDDILLAAEKLKQSGRLYPCFESAEELRFKQEQRRKRGKATIYDRAMLRLTAAQRAAAEANGKRPHWRFRLSDRTLVWDDLAMGRREVKLPSVSDPVVLDAGGMPMPIFASVAADIASGITHVIRGEDSAGNTGIQLDLFDALGARPPRFAHLPALADDVHAPLGRRVAGLTVRSLRGDGVVPMALALCLTADLTPAIDDAKGPGGAEAPDWLGASAPGSLAELAPGFAMRPGSTGLRFDTGRLLRLNRRILRSADFASVADRLPGGATEAFWMAIRGEIDLLSEARGWWDVVAGTIIPPVMADDHEVLQAALRTLPPEPWDLDVLDVWLTQLVAVTGLRERTLLGTLRLALTGEDTGPDLRALLPLIGRTRSAARLRIAAS